MWWRSPYFTGDPGSVGNALSLMKSRTGGRTGSRQARLSIGSQRFEDREMIIVDDGPPAPTVAHLCELDPISGHRTHANPLRALDNGGQTFDPRSLSAMPVMSSTPCRHGSRWRTLCRVGERQFDCRRHLHRWRRNLCADRIVSTAETAPLFFGTLQSSTGAGLMVSDTRHWQ